MPTDAELLSACELVLKWYDGPGTAQEPFTKLRALFARPEPERMSVRLEIASRILAAWCTGDEFEPGFSEHALRIADALIAADKESRQ